MRARPIIGLVLALLWAPITSHCLLEQLSGFDFLSCCTHGTEPCAGEEEDCETDACAVVEQGFYKVQDNGDLVPERLLDSTPFLSAMFLTASVKSLPDVHPRFPLCDFAASWQFTYRTALPIRAPSLVG